MPWLDDHKKSIGLELIICTDGIEHPASRHYYTTVDNSKYWKGMYGVHVQLHPSVPIFLGAWPTNRRVMKLPERLSTKNVLFLARHRSYDGRFPTYDYIDHQYLQYGLDGCLWEEFPKGIPGIIVDYSDPFQNHAGWVNVQVTKSFTQAPDGVKLPCKGVLTWDT